MATFTFTPGQSYQKLYITDSDLRVEVHVVRRTEKSVWVLERGEDTPVRKVVRNDRDGEYIVMGNYSMAPSVDAKRVWVGESQYMKEEAPEVAVEAPEAVEVDQAPEVAVEAPVAVEEAPEATIIEMVADAVEGISLQAEAEARSRYAEEDLKAVEEEGLHLIGHTLYGQLTVAHVPHKPMQYIVRGAVEFKTDSRVAMLTFLASCYSVEV